MTILRLTAIAAVLSALAVPAIAESREDQFFRELDTNGDGVVSPEEFTLQKGVILYMLDANHDLKIERSETKLSQQVYSQYAGKDGVIDGGDLFNLPAAGFNAFDRNGDQKITRDEFHQQLADLRGNTPQTAEQK